MRLTPPVARLLSTAVMALALAVLIEDIRSIATVLSALSVIALVLFFMKGRSIPRMTPALAGLVLVAMMLDSVPLAPLMVFLIVIAMALDWAGEVGTELRLSSMRRPAILAVAAGLLTALFSGFAVGPLSPTSLGDGTSLDGLPATQAPLRPASSLPSWLADAIARVIGFFRLPSGGAGEGSPGGLGSIPPDAELPPAEIDWWRVLLVALAIAALIALVWWLWRRRSGRSVVDEGGDWAVRSLDRTGERVARPRRGSEDPASYGASIGGDVDHEGAHGRLRAAGAMVSAHLYRPVDAATDGDDRRLRSTLAGLDDLPSAPPPRRSRARRLVGIGLAVMLLAGAGWFALRPASDADGPSESMFSAPATDADGFRWVLCRSVNATEPQGFAAEGRGWVDRDADVAVAEMFEGWQRLEVRDGDEWTATSDSGAVLPEGWSSGLDELRTIDGVIAGFDLDVESGRAVAAPSESLADGGTRHEWQRENQVLDAWATPVPGSRLSIFETYLQISAFRVEAWTDGDAIVQRIRVTSQEFDQVVSELRFVDSVPDIAVPTEIGASTLPLFSDCEGADAGESGWLGFEPFEPSISTVSTVRLDDDGHPYDATSVFAGGEIAATSLGTMSLDDGRVTVDDVYSFGAGPDVVPIAEIDLEADTASELVVTRFDVERDREEIDVPVGLRLALDGRDVEQWSAVELECLSDAAVLSGGEPSGVDVGDLYDDWDASMIRRSSGVDWIVVATWSGCFEVYEGLIGGEVHSVVIRDVEVPWRWIVSDGAVPSNVAEEEARLLRCLEPDARIGAYGVCRE